MLYYNQKGKGDTKMNEYRENLIDRMIRIYGFESPIVIDFCRMCEMTCMSDKALTTIVECHEEYPITED